MFKLLESYIVLLGLEAVKIVVVNCKAYLMCELSVTCNAFWGQFKMVDGRETITFVKNL